MKRLALLTLPALLTGCAPLSPPRLRQADFRGTIWAEGQRRAGILFQDAGQSVSVEGGTLWLFGDTFIGNPQPDQPPQNRQITGAHSMTMAFLPAGRSNLPPALNYVSDPTGLATNPMDYLPNESRERNRLWPGGAISTGSRLYLYYSLIEVTTNPPPWNFRSVGGGLAVAQEPARHFRRLLPDGRWRFPVEPSQVIREGDTLYLYELKKEPNGVSLARVGANQIENPAAYEFFTSGKWTTNPADAKLIVTQVYGQVSVNWIPALRSYLMATSSDPFHPLEIQLRRSHRLEGPWSEPVRIPVPETPGKKTSLVYCTFVHPELGDAQSPRLVATFCRILEGQWELCNPEYVILTLAAD